MNIGKQIKLLREERKWTQEILAKKMGVHTPRIAQYETGGVTPSLARVHQFASVFGVSVQEFEPLSRFRVMHRWNGVSKTAFGQMIYDRRIELHLTRTEVAVSIGIEPSTVGGYERGENHPMREKTVKALAKSLQIEEACLFSVWKKPHMGSALVEIVDGKKRCAVCGHMRSIKLFHKNKHTLTGLHSYCKFCREKKRKGLV